MARRSLASLLLQLFLFALAVGCSVEGLTTVNGESIRRFSRTPSMSSFVSRNLREAGHDKSSSSSIAQQELLFDVSCARNASICRDRTKNPFGGSTCCPIFPFIDIFSFCRDVNADVFNCGACGHVCEFGETCCSGKCVFTLIDPSNCGRCGNNCVGPRTCFVGLCGYGGGED